MNFSGLTFLYVFLPAVLLIYSVVQRRTRAAVLFLGSLVFFILLGGVYALSMLVLLLVYWLCSMAMERHEGKIRPALLALSVIAGVALLCWLRFTRPAAALSAAVGIMTLRGISYSLGVYGEEFPAERSAVVLGACILPFPQLTGWMAEPCNETASALRLSEITLNGIYLGIKRFTVGLGKNVLIAGLLGGFASAFREADSLSVGLCWLYSLSCVLGLYYQLSGLSDMAIGLSGIFGIKLPENFSYPLLSGSIYDLSRRWMITVGGCIRHIVKSIPALNGKSAFLRLLGIISACTVFGLTLGFKTRFLLFGLLLGLIICLERLAGVKKSNALTRLYTLVFLLLAALLFTSESLAEAGKTVAAMFGFGGLPVWNGLSGSYAGTYLTVFLIALLGASPLPSAVWRRFETSSFGSRAAVVLEPLFVLGILALSTAFLVDGAFSSFSFLRL